LDSLHPDTVFTAYPSVGQYYGGGGGKAYNLRTVFRVDVGTALVGWTGLTAARFVGDVSGLVGAAFAATLRRVTEEFTYTQATYNHRTTGDLWLSAGADEPYSATATDKIMFTSPSACGLQNIVIGLLTLVQDAIDHRGGIFLFHIRSDDEVPRESRNFELGTFWWLEVDGTPPVGRRRGVRVV
jgi:hypothetical protein